MFSSWVRLWRSWCMLASVPLLPEAELSELTPLVVDRVEIVLAALEPITSLLLLANGSSELWISSMAFWWYPARSRAGLLGFMLIVGRACWPMLGPDALESLHIVPVVGCALVREFRHG